jgi:hypothetical protein
MIIAKTNPVGIDQVIDRMQTYLENKLAFATWENNHRAYINPKISGQDGFIAEVYVSNGEYRECFYDDRFNATSFFITSDTTQTEDKRLVQTVSWIFQCNLKKLAALIPHRADEEIRNKVINAFKSMIGIYEIESIETGIDNVYNEFERSKLKNNNMSDLYVLRVNVQVKYDSTCCDNCTY